MTNSKMDAIEVALIGGVINNPEKLIDADCLPEHFETSAYGQIYQVILDMESDNKPIDLFTVAEQLERKTSKDWMQTLAQIAQHSVDAKNVTAYSEAIRAKHIERQSVFIAQRMISEISHEGQKCVDHAIVELMTLGETSKDTTRTLKQAMRESLDHLDRVCSGDAPIALTTGFEVLDANIGGFHNSDLIVIGARPAMGKTALLINLMLNSNEAAGFFSTEQSAAQIALRMFSIQGGISSTRIRTGDLDQEHWSGIAASTALLQERQIFIDEATRPNIAEVQRQARKWKQQYDIKSLWVDYIQRIDGPDMRAPKFERVEEVTKGLKSLAKELDIPVIALSQVKRAVDDRPLDKRRPGMGDLSDSSAVEKEADIIMMLYRDEVHNEDTNFPGIAELIIEKNRHGPTNFVKLAWIGSTFRFKDLTHENYYNH